MSSFNKSILLEMECVCIACSRSRKARFSPKIAPVTCAWFGPPDQNVWVQSANKTPVHQPAEARQLSRVHQLCVLIIENFYRYANGRQRFGHLPKLFVQPKSRRSPMRSPMRSQHIRTGCFKLCKPKIHLNTLESGGRLVHQ